MRDLSIMGAADLLQLISRNDIAVDVDFFTMDCALTQRTAIQIAQSVMKQSFRLLTISISNGTMSSTTNKIGVIQRFI